MVFLAVVDSGLGGCFDDVDVGFRCVVDAGIKLIGKSNSDGVSVYGVTVLVIHFGAGVVLYCIRLALKLENLLCFSRLWTSAVKVRLPFGPRIEVPFMSSFGRCRVIISGIAWGLFGSEFPLPSLTMLRLPERLILPIILRLGAGAG